MAESRNPSRKHSCGSLVGSKPLHTCCFTTCFHEGRGFDLDVVSQPNGLDVVSQPNSRAYLLHLYPVGESRSLSERSLNLRVETPTLVGIPRSQCIMAATLFVGLLMSYSVRCETPNPVAEDDEQVETLAQWIAELNNIGSVSSTFSYVSVFTDYEVTGIRGDGRSLFRAIAYGDCVRRGVPMPNEKGQLYLVGVLRTMALEFELEPRRKKIEKFIEGDFEEYVRRMGHDETLGGEIEILMACHIVMVPIRVFRYDAAVGGMKLIAIYGLIYQRRGRSINILYKGSSRYDAFDVPGRTRRGGM